MFVAMNVPEYKKLPSRRAELVRVCCLAFGSLGFGMIEKFSLHSILHSGLFWVFAVSAICAIVSVILLQDFVKRDKEMRPAEMPR